MTTILPSLMSQTAFRVRSLYRQLFRAASQFSSYNFREYAKRRTRDGFRQHLKDGDEKSVQKLLEEGRKSLLMLKRQTTIGNFYQIDRLVVEGGSAGKERNSGDIVRQKEPGYD